MIVTDRARIGVQLYTLRSLSKRLEPLLDVAASAGAEVVETVGRHGVPAEELRDALAARDLRAISSHVPLSALEADPDAEAAFARVAGVETLVVPFLAPDERPAGARGWAQLGARLDRVGARLADAGVRLAYHNHDVELALVEGRTGLDWLLDAADPAHLGAELDLAWVARAGRDPAEVLRRWGPRTWLLHVKDLAPPGASPEEDGWATAGSGILPWDALLALANEVGVRAWLLEHDRPADPERTVQDGCAYLRRRRDATDAQTD